MHCIEQLFGMWQATRTLARHASTIGRSDQRALRQSSGDPQSPELNEILQELQAALAEHTRRLRKLVADFPARAKRRSTDND